MSIDGWQGTIDRVASLHQRSDEGDLSSTTATSLTSTHMKNGDAELTKSSPIVAPSLLDGLKNLDESSASSSNVEAVKAYSAISFSGGSSELVFADSGRSETTNKDTITVAFDLKAGFKVDFMITIFGLGVRGKVGGGVIAQYDHEEGTETKESHSYTRSFTLSDPDDGDAFDIQVWQLLSCALCSECMSRDLIGCSPLLLVNYYLIVHFVFLRIYAL
jgi:hypothetical protein